MESQPKQESVDKNKSKIKKKIKNKEKKRLMNLFRGPKTDHKFYYKPNEEEVNCIKNSLIDVLKENPSLKLHKVKKKNESNDKNVEKNEPQIKLTNELMFGLNEIIRAIEKKSTIGVIITDPLAIHLLENIIELCANNSIPCLSVDSFDELKTYLNISSLTAMAFKPTISSDKAIFYNLYQTFLNIVHKNCDINQNISDTNEQTVSSVKEMSEKIISSPAKKSEESFDKSLYEILYTKDSDDNYRDLVEEHMKRVNDSYNYNDINMIQHSFLPFSEHSELYFPRRITQNKIIAKIKVIVDEEIKTCDESFAESLMEVSVENVHKVMKRKSCQKNKTNAILNYREPEIVRLEPSTNKIQKRQQRKLFKKNKTKLFKSK
jgi:ribosomal protein L7Ae-like RNA K-turn-binding protein